MRICTCGHADAVHCVEPYKVPLRERTCFACDACHGFVHRDPIPYHRRPLSALERKRIKGVTP